MYFGQKNTVNLREPITTSRTFPTEDKGKRDVLFLIERGLYKYAGVIGCELQWVSDGSQRYFDVYHGRGCTKHQYLWQQQKKHTNLHKILHHLLLTTILNNCYVHVLWYLNSIQGTSNNVIQDTVLLKTKQRSSVGTPTCCKVAFL